MQLWYAVWWQSDGFLFLFPEEASETRKLYQDEAEIQMKFFDRWMKPELCIMVFFRYSRFVLGGWMSRWWWSSWWGQRFELWVVFGTLYWLKYPWSPFRGDQTNLVFEFLFQYTCHDSNLKFLVRLKDRRVGRLINKPSPLESGGGGGWGDYC